VLGLSSPIQANHLESISHCFLGAYIAVLGYLAFLIQALDSGKMLILNTAADKQE